MNAMMTLKASTRAELFGAVTAMLGFTPTQSLALLPFSGSCCRSAMRIDLPTNTDDAGEMLARALELLCNVPDVTGFVAIVFTDDTAATHEPLAQALKMVAPMFSLNAMEVLYMTPTGWGSFFEGDEAPRDTLPPQPMPELVADGDQHAEATLPVVDEQLRIAIRAAARDLTEGEAVCDLFEEALTWDPVHLDPAKAAALAAHLAKPALRDVALVQWASGVEHGRTAIAMQTGGSFDPHVAAVIVGEADRPDPARLDAAFAVCRIIAAHTERGERAAALTACAWLSWALGKSTRAEFFAKQALRSPEAPTFAPVIAGMIDRAIVPAWAFAR